MNKNTLIAIAVVIVLLVGAVFFIGQKKTTQAPAPETSTEAKPTQSMEKTTTDSNAPVKEISVTAKQFAFSPDTIKVKQGDKVRLKIKSVDVAHGVGIPDFNVSVDLAPGKEETVEFVADKKGEFTFFCSVFCGSGHPDMKGKLIVE